MTIPFVKMHGAGNDFILIDNRGGDRHLDRAQVRTLCSRRRGVGADGVILIESSNEAAFRMRYYNSDGGEAEMCGNGARCAVFLAAELGLGEERGDGCHMHFLAGPGLMGGTVEGSRVAIGMTDASSFERDVSLAVAGGEEKVHFINTGVPHAVVVERDVQSLDDQELVERGRAIRMHSAFAPDGANADFVTRQSDGAVAIRTYERGVEDETEACGTGAVAAAVVLERLGLVESPVTLVTRGGEAVRVSFKGETWGAREVVLEGPTAVSFRGNVDLTGGD